MRKLRVYKLAFLLVAVMTANTANADSDRAECAFTKTSSASIGAPRNETSACTYSQRQGHINIEIDGGPKFDFLPTGDTPGHYSDANGQAVFRRSGLGEQGVIFQLRDRFLYVYWKQGAPGCEAAVISSLEGCRLTHGGIAFTIQAGNTGSLNAMRVSATGADLLDQHFDHEIDGMAYRAETADLDANGWPELYVYISSAGSGSYGSLVAYAVNNGKSITPVYLPPVGDDSVASAGYMGHDEFSVVENRLVQRFPIYGESDTNSAPTGGTRQIQYKLVPGEAGWILETDRVVDY